ncbi:MAG: hypothetical protein AAFQ94_14610 [Bacteroidota bacterium]
MKKYLLLSLFSFVLLSCQDDDSDTSSPTITIVNGLNDGDEIWGTILIEFDVEENLLNDRIEISLDDQLIATLNADQTTFEFVSTDYEDGTYSLNIVAFDAAGNMSNELKVDFSIKNILTVISIGENYLNPDYTNIFFITDSQNNLLGSTLVENGEQYVFKRPDSFNELTFNYHFLEGVNENTIALISTVAVEIADFVFEKSETSSNDRGESLGQANLSIVNVPDHDYFNFFPGDYILAGELLRDNPIDVEIFENRDDYYVYFKNGDNGYYKEGQLKQGTEVLDFFDFSDAMERFEVSVDGNIGTMTIAAEDMRAGGRVKPLYLNFFGSRSGKLVWHLPSEREHFGNYFSTFSYSRNSLNYQSVARNSTEFQIPEHIDASLSVQSIQVNNMEIDTEGKFDELSVVLIANDSPQFFVWRISTKDTNSPFDTFPTLPEEVVSRFQEFTVSAFDNITSSSVKLTEIYNDGDERSVSFRE